MDIHTLLTVRDMYKDEDVDFDRWLKVRLNELELIENERAEEHVKRVLNKGEIA
jgi:hypothetical protein